MTIAAAMRAGMLYFAVVFSFAFVIGTARTLWLAPAIGATQAVMIEVPILLAISWAAARSIMRRPALNNASTQALAGGFAFLLLMMTELALASALAGQTPMQWAASLFVVPGIIGLAGQVGFAAMPWLIGGAGPRPAIRA